MPATKTPEPSPTEPVTPTPTLPAIPELDCILPDSPRQTARVIAVIDGDTIDVSIKGLVFRVRYLGIDTPETPDDRFGPEATTRNRELAGGEIVTMIRDPNDEDVDIYGRMLRYIITDDAFVNLQLVREGFAFLYPSGHTCGPEFLQAYDAARADAVGLFAHTPLP
ncbi:MAG: hypothetical protein HND51_19735 [Chloroflexi bacterium]|nr:hypothetical protein [Chloroflexota bacterium]